MMHAVIQSILIPRGDAATRENITDDVHEMK